MLDPAWASLSFEDRLRLVEELWDSLADEPEALAVTQSQREELDRRLAGYEQDGNGGRPAQEVLDEIRRRI